MSLRNYETLRTIGQGSYGKVNLVTRRGDRKLYVMKVVRNETLGEGDHVIEALREVNVLKNLHHPNIVEFKEAFTNNSNEKLFIVMCYCECGDLSDQIKKAKKRRRFFSQEKVMNWFVQLSLALGYLHEKHILHRDLKPQNVFLANNSRIVKLGDFGITKTLENTAAQAITTIGTPYYFSPEICQNRPYGVKSDIWSFGCVIYETLTLSLPFEAKNLPQLRRKILQSRPACPNKNMYDPAFLDLVASMLAKGPERRPNIRQVLHCEVIRGPLQQVVESYSALYNPPPQQQKQQQQHLQQRPINSAPHQPGQNLDDNDNNGIHGTTPALPPDNEMIAGGHQNPQQQQQQQQKQSKKQQQNGGIGKHEIQALSNQFDAALQRLEAKRRNLQERKTQLQSQQDPGKTVLIMRDDSLPKGLGRDITENVEKKEEQKTPAMLELEKLDRQIQQASMELHALAQQAEEENTYNELIQQCTIHIQVGQIFNNDNIQTDENYNGEEQGEGLTVPDPLIQTDGFHLEDLNQENNDNETKQQQQPQPPSQNNQRNQNAQKHRQLRQINNDNNNDNDNNNENNNNNNKNKKKKKKNNNNNHNNRRHLDDEDGNGGNFDNGHGNGNDNHHNNNHRSGGNNKHHCGNNNHHGDNHSNNNHKYLQYNSAKINNISPRLNMKNSNNNRISKKKNHNKKLSHKKKHSHHYQQQQQQKSQQQQYQFQFPFDSQSKSKKMNKNNNKIHNMEGFNFPFSNDQLDPSHRQQRNTRNHGMGQISGGKNNNKNNNLIETFPFSLSNDNTYVPKQAPDEGYTRPVSRRGRSRGGRRPVRQSPEPAHGLLQDLPPMQKGNNNNNNTDVLNISEGSTNRSINQNDNLGPLINYKVNSNAPSPIHSIASLSPSFNDQLLMSNENIVKSNNSSRLGFRPLSAPNDFQALLDQEQLQQFRIMQNITGDGAKH